MLNDCVSIDEKTQLHIAASRTADGGVSLTVTNDGEARTSVYLSDRAQAHHLLNALVNAARHMGWLSEGHAETMATALRKEMHLR